MPRSSYGAVVVVPEDSFVRRFLILLPKSSWEAACARACVGRTDDGSRFFGYARIPLDRWRDVRADHVPGRLTAFTTRGGAL